MTTEQVLMDYVSKLRQSDNGRKHVLADTIVNIVLPDLKRAALAKAKEV